MSGRAAEKHITHVEHDRSVRLNLQSRLFGESLAEASDQLSESGSGPRPALCFLDSLTTDTFDSVDNRANPCLQIAIRCAGARISARRRTMCLLQASQSAP